LRGWAEGVNLGNIRWWTGIHRIVCQWTTLSKATFRCARSKMVVSISSISIPAPVRKVLTIIGH
jgi:hypothetical protein